MDRQQIGLKLTMDALGLPVRLASFSERLILQKAVYLAQAAGVKLGYSFHWYLRGPYSPSLTRDAFAVEAELAQGEDDSRGWNLDATSVNHLRPLKMLIEQTQKSQLSLRLELLASVYFLLQSPTGQGKSKAELRAILARYGKNFTEDDIQQAIEELKRHGLCPRNSSK